MRETRSWGLRVVVVEEDGVDEDGEVLEADDDAEEEEEGDTVGNEGDVGEGASSVVSADSSAMIGASICPSPVKLPKCW